MPQQLMSIAEITREAVQLWQNSNAFLAVIDLQWEELFTHTVADAPMMMVSVPKALALGAIATVICNPVVVRRFLPPRSRSPR